MSLRPFPFGSLQADFQGTRAHHVESVSFAPSYPGAYELARDVSGGCLDIHPIVSAANAICLFLTTLLLDPAPGVLYSILVLLGYIQIMLFSNPPRAPPNWEIVFQRLVPVLFAAYFFWRVSFRRTLPAFRRLPLELAIWQGFGYWIGIESSTIFAKLPIDRLGYGTLSAGGVVSLIVIIVLVIILALVQAWQMRRLGMLQYYIAR